MATETMQCEVLDPEFRQVVSGLPGAEGPVFTADGRFFMVAPEVEVEGKPAGQFLTVNLQDESPQAVVLSSPQIDGDGGIPAGCQADREGNLWVADMRLGVLKVTQQGQIQQISRVDSDGDMMQGCNDCTFDYEGNLWVTAPAGEIAPIPYRRSFEEAFGSVYCVPQATQGHPSVIKVATGIHFPNGIAVQHLPDGRPSLLIVAETPKKTLWAFDITAPEKLENKRVWGTLPGDHEGGPDGMDFDDMGHLIVANWGAGHLEVFGPQGGDPVFRIRCPFLCPSNLHFRPDSNQVYVTEHSNHALWTFRWKHTARKEYCQLMLV